LEDKPKGMDRRTFLRRAAVTGAAAAWAAPVIQTVTARPAFATGNGTPFCGHSVGASVGTDCSEGAMGACKFACKGTCAEEVSPSADPCNEITLAACVGSPDRPCCNAGLCDTANWTCSGSPPNEMPCYTGPTTGCTNDQIAALTANC